MTSNVRAEEDNVNQVSRNFQTKMAILDPLDQMVVYIAGLTMKNFSREKTLHPSRSGLPEMV